METGCDLNEVAIFYRVNSMSRQIEEAFVRRQIPYQVVRGVEFYSRKEVRDLLSYLRLVGNPDDDIAFMRAVGTHPRGIGKTTLDRLAAFAERSGMNLYEAARQASLIDAINKPTQGRLVAFAVVINSFIEASAGKVAELMETILEESGMLDALRKNDVDAIENITELINAASKYDEQTEEPSLVDYLQSIALYSDSDAYDAASGKVSLMTLHAAKGLEFDTAFIIGLEDGLLPHERSLYGSDEELEEERRLFFVGITRARKQLFISHAKHRVMRGQFLRTTPSQFLYEIGVAEEENRYDTEFAQTHYDDDAPAFGKRDAEFMPGQLVNHKKFGLGRVKEYMDLGESSIVVVKFNTGKTKSLMVAYANLTKMG
jgi:DNA helicase-2/ATP-dependent DNA helicase PcrA